MAEYLQMTNYSLKEFLIISSCVAFIPAFCEEVLFGGYLMQNIGSKNSKTYAIIISAVIFSAIHLVPAAFLTIFVLGYFLGKLFYASNSIIPAIILHFLNNFVIFLAFNYYPDSLLRVEYLAL